MKFGEELVAERIPEWADKYLDYRAGKKLIKAVADAIERQETGVAAPSQRRAGLSGLSIRRRAQPARVPESPVYQPPRPPPGDIEAAEGLDPVAVAFSLHGDGYQPPGQSSRHASSSLGGPAAEPAERDPPPPRQPGRTVTQRRQERAMKALLAPFTGARTRFFDGDMQPLNPTDPVEKAKTDFLHFLFSELQRVDTFYTAKEEEAGARLRVLRAQLHEMRNRKNHDALYGTLQKLHDDEGDDLASRSLLGRMKGSVIELASFGKNPRSSTIAHALPNPMLTPIATVSQRRRDFVPKRVTEEEAVSYKEAKRKIKTAVHELYRSLDLVQSYAALNRTAFQKLNKKYDKNARSSEKLEFMHNYVDRSHFVSSTVIDGHMRTIEDLFARYFERDNTKAALTKLRARKVRDESLGTFNSGVLVGLGGVFSIQGFISALRMMFDENTHEDKRNVVGSHLQIYGGYFLLLCMGWMFCLNCYIWTRAKVNYPFIFEFDTRTSLDWRTLCQFPSVFSLLFGVIFWLNFSAEWGSLDLFLWYPVILIGASLVVLFLPLPVFHHKSRLWFAYSHWRLLMAPFYPVEFRDVFLGDIYCSLRYSFQNIELFFCVYANGWEEPEDCGSSKSRLMAFLSALPPMWRAIQCIRRYYDTRSFFPHLANCAKYLIFLFMIVGLSEYRILGGEVTLSFFIGLATLNTVYSSWWDIYMDFRLAQKKAPHYLRDILAFKTEWVYYAAMVADPLLRMSWVAYLIFSKNMQHSSVASYVISLIEVFRRMLWISFRVENEHCVNIANNKASREIPLPYNIKAGESDLEEDEGER